MNKKRMDITLSFSEEAFEELTSSIALMKIVDSFLVGIDNTHTLALLVMACISKEIPKINIEASGKKLKGVPVSKEDREKLISSP